MSLVAIVVMLAVIGLLLWAVEQIPMDATVRTIIRVVVVVFLCLWLLQTFGLLGEGPVLRLR